MSKIALAILLTGSIAGQLFQLRFAGIDLPLVDISLLAAIGLLGYHALATRQYLSLWQHSVSRAAIVMSAILALAYVAAVFQLENPKDMIISGLYCLRLIGYLLLVPGFMVSAKSTDVRAMQTYLLAAGAVMVVAGFVQLALFSNFQIFDHFGWDPHKGRLIGTFLDPNFTAVWLLQIFWLAISVSMFAPRTDWRSIWVALASLAATLLTVSRTGLLALVGSAIAYALLISRRWAIVVMVAGVASVLFVPALRDRVSGAIELDTTVRFRLESWEGAANLIRQQPVLGVGYNTLKFRRYENALPGTSRLISRFEDGIIRETQLTSRSDTGFDSSLLTILATTGLVGFGWFLWWVWQTVWANLKRRTASSRWYLASTATLFIGSWFINAWLYPPILILWLVAMVSAEVE